jgi:hypothetical protein
MSQKPLPTVSAESRSELCDASYSPKLAQVDAYPHPLNPAGLICFGKT